MMQDFIAMLTDPDMGAVTFAVERVTIAMTDKGRAVENVERMEVMGSVQPATGKERELLPEGESASEVMAIYTAFPLRVNNEGENKADVVLFNGYRYRVAMVQDWSVNGEHFCHALAVYAGAVGKGASHAR